MSSTGFFSSRAKIISLLFCSCKWLLSNNEKRVLIKKRMTQMQEDYNLYGIAIKQQIKQKSEW